MSHGKLRKENNCLNCNAIVTGRFCSVCGQENIEPRETFWQLVTHFTYDVFHYDGKFLSTFKVLLLKPGQLTNEYVRGKRAAYLHPIRMYIFAAAIFFIIFLSFIIGGNNHSIDVNQLNPLQANVINKSIQNLEDSLIKTNDPAKKMDLRQSISKLKKVQFLFTDTVAHINKESSISLIKIDTADHAPNFLSSRLPATLAEYKQQQDTITPEKKDGWISRIISTKLIAINEKYRYNPQGFIDDFTERFFHSLPTMMFVSLPVAALIFQLLYLRKRKQFTYVQHSVFLVHIYVAVYFFILVVYGFNLLENITHWQLFGFLSAITIISIFYYLYRAMYNFYAQGIWKTIFKFLVLLFAYFIVLALLMILFFMNSLIQI